MSEPIIDLTESSPPPVEQGRIPTAKALLQSAIDTAQPARLRETLQAICNSSADAAHIASILLLVPENQAKKMGHRKASEESSDEDEDDSEETSDENSDESEDEDEAKNGTEDIEAASTNLKRLRPRYAICENCSEEFDVTDNGKKACSYHDGELEPDYEMFVDHDEDCHGRIDSSDMREQFPENFMYTCCDEDGLSEGCKTGRHVEENVTYKRPRFGFPIIVNGNLLQNISAIAYPAEYHDQQGAPTCDPNPEYIEPFVDLEKKFLEVVQLEKLYSGRLHGGTLRWKQDDQVVVLEIYWDGTILMRP